MNSLRAHRFWQIRRCDAVRILVCSCVLPFVAGCQPGKTPDATQAKSAQQKSTQPQTSCDLQRTKAAAMAPGLQFEVKAVSVLPHIGARFTTMNLIPKGENQHWTMNQYGVFGKQVVHIPEQQNSIWIEALILVRNNGVEAQKFRFKSPRLELSGGQTIQPWESLPGGMYGSYDEIAGDLGLSREAPEKGSNAIQLLLSSDIESNLSSGQQTWVIMDFQVPQDTKNAKLGINGYPTSPIEIPMYCE